MGTGGSIGKGGKKGKLDMQRAENSSGHGEKKGRRGSKGDFNNQIKLEKQHRERPDMTSGQLRSSPEQTEKRGEAGLGIDRGCNRGRTGEAAWEADPANLTTTRAHSKSAPGCSLGIKPGGNRELHWNASWVGPGKQTGSILG